MKNEELLLRRKIKMLIWFFIVSLVLSGLTAFPLEWQLSLLHNWSAKHLNPDNQLYVWIKDVYQGIKETNAKYPFLAYGTDWLAFSHIVIATAFIGPLKDPVRNIWVIEFGIIACIMVFPLALIAGAIRQIPVYWRLIDCAFGALGIIPLLLCHKLIKQLNK